MLTLTWIRPKFRRDCSPSTELLAWVQQYLAPTLSPGAVVLMDNQSRHKVKGVREPIESDGGELRDLPPSTTELNPIEMAFSTLKKLLRDRAERTVDALWNLSGRIFNEDTCQDRRNDFRHCGYRNT